MTTIKNPINFIFLPFVLLLKALAVVLGFIIKPKAEKKPTKPEEIPEETAHVFTPTLRAFPLLVPFLLFMVSGQIAGGAVLAVLYVSLPIALLLWVHIATTKYTIKNGLVIVSRAGKGDQQIKIETINNIDTKLWGLNAGHVILHSPAGKLKIKNIKNPSAFVAVLNAQ